MKVKIKGLVVALALGAMSFSAVTQAEVYRWNLGTYGFLDFDSASSNFRLYDNASTSGGVNGLGDNNGINGLTFSFNSAVGLSTGSVASFSTAFDTAFGTTYKPLTFTGVSSIANTVYTYTGASNQTIDELVDGQSASFNFGNILFSNIAGVGFRLNDNNANNLNTGSIISATSVGQVPEVEISAMMLLGLGVLGFAARRRKQA